MVDDYRRHGVLAEGKAGVTLSPKLSKGPLNKDAFEHDGAAIGGAGYQSTPRPREGQASAGTGAESAVPTVGWRDERQRDEERYLASEQRARTAEAAAVAQESAVIAADSRARRRKQRRWRRG